MSDNNIWYNNNNNNNSNNNNDNANKNSNNNNKNFVFRKEGVAKHNNMLTLYNPILI